MDVAEAVDNAARLLHDAEMELNLVTQAQLIDMAREWINLANVAIEMQRL